jgi:hypothetical protein
MHAWRPPNAGDPVDGLGDLADRLVPGEERIEFRAMPTADPKQGPRRSTRSDEPMNGAGPAAAEPKEDAARELARVRVLARKQGLRIRRAKAGRGSTRPTYELIDGAVVIATSGDLDGLRTVLSHPRDDRFGGTNGTNAADPPEPKRRVAGDQPGGPMPNALDAPPTGGDPSGPGTSDSISKVQSSSGSPSIGRTGPACPSCGTVRIGSFRFCRTCGMDFEPAHSLETASPATPVEPVVMPVEHLDFTTAGGFGRISTRITENVGRAPSASPSPAKPTVESSAPASRRRPSPWLQSALILIGALIVAAVVGAIVPLLLSMFLR